MERLDDLLLASTGDAATEEQSKQNAKDLQERPQSIHANAR